LSISTTTKLKHWFIQHRIVNDVELFILVGQKLSQKGIQFTFTSEILDSFDRFILTKQTVYELEGPPLPIFKLFLDRVNIDYNPQNPIPPQLLAYIKN